MKHGFCRIPRTFVTILIFAPRLLQAQGTAFTYQGRITDNGTNFTGTGQFKFALVTSSNASHQATATANAPSGGFITGYLVTFGGSGYVTAPAVTVTGGGGSGAAGIAHLTGNTVTSISVANPGDGNYTNAPTVVVAPPPQNISYTTYWSNDGTSVAGSEPSAAVNASVSNGLFTVVLGDTTAANMTAIDPSLFTQPNLQLRIWFNDGVSGFSALNPAQNLSATPYAMFANSSSNLSGTLSAAQISGTISSANLSGIYSGPVTLSNANNTFSGSYGGNGGGLTNVNAEAIVAIRSNTLISAWGNNGNGQATITAGLTNLTATAVGQFFSLGLKSDGTVTAWGDNSYGQTNVPPGLTGVVAVGGGAGNSVALKGNGTVIAWGDNSIGEINVPPGLSNVATIAVGATHTLALHSDGTVIAWGFNGAGETNVPAGLNGVAAIAAGNEFSLVLKSNGTLMAWGLNSWGQTNIPTGLSNVIAISAGQGHALALKSDGTVVAWGYNGLNATNVPPGLSNVVAISAGRNTSFALKADGNVIAWGDNYYGETTGAALVDGVIALTQGSEAAHTIVFRRQVTSPVALTGSDNTFSGRVQFSGMILGKVGINTATPQQALHIVAPPGQGEGMEIDSAVQGHSPAIYLNHTDTGGHNFRIASFGQGSSYAAFIVRDDSVGTDRLTIDNNGNFLLGNGNFTVGNGNFAFGNGNFNVGTGTLRAEVGTGKKFSLGGNGTFEVDAPGIIGGRFFISDPGGNVGIGTNNPSQKLHVIGNILATGTVTGSSDRNAKQNFKPVNAGEILDKVAALPITRWSYKADAEVTHLGPMAQDFYAAFDIGMDDKHISMVDADGVALAAIQGLNQKLEDGGRKAEDGIEKLQEQLKQKETEITELKGRLEKIEQLMNQRSGGAQ